MSLCTPRTPRTLAATAAAFALAGSAAAAPFTLSTPNGNGLTAYGQNFRPSAGATPDPGLAAGDPVYLSSFAFTSSGAGTGNAATRLAILAGAYYDFRNAVTATSAIGVSSNAVDTTASVYGTAYAFDFGGLELAYDQADYTAAFVTDAGDGTFTPLAVSVANVEFEESSPGTFTPVVNLGGTDNFNVAALFGPPNNGFLRGQGAGADLALTATFDTVPEPASLALVVLGGAALLGRRRA